MPFGDRKKFITKIFLVNFFILLYHGIRKSYVVFITRKDVLGAGKPLYHIDRTIRETNGDFGDGSHILYVNGSCQNETPLGWLMQDFSQQEAQNFHYDQLGEQVRYLKDTEGGSDKMCEMMQDYCNKKFNEGMQMGRTEGQADAAKKMAKSLLMLGTNTLDQISLVTQIPVDELQRMKAELKS